MTKTITITQGAYEVLRKLKRGEQSFSEVITENLKPRAETCGELLDELERDFVGVNLLNPERTKALLAGRGRRSNRPNVPRH